MVVGNVLMKAVLICQLRARGITGIFVFRNSTRCCYSCGTFASQVRCGARKLVQFSLGSEIAQFTILAVVSVP